MAAQVALMMMINNIISNCWNRLFPILFQKNTTQILVEPKRIIRKIRVIRSQRKESFVVEDGDALHGDFSLQKRHNVIGSTNLLADSHLRYDVLSLKRHRNVIPFCGHEIFSRGAEIFFCGAEFFKNLVDFFC